MDFEYDEVKSQLNEQRHGIRLEQAADLWNRTHLILPARSVSGEDRYAILGELEDKLYVAIFTRRRNSLRLISCHRADQRWRRIYERYV